MNVLKISYLLGCSDKITTFLLVKNSISFARTNVNTVNEDSGIYKTMEELFLKISW